MKKYDNYKDSGIEWIGEIPEHWEVKPFKHLVICNSEALTEKTNPEMEINYIEIGDVNSFDGIKETSKYTFEKAPSRARRIVREGDVIISTVRTYLKAITSISSKFDGFIASTGFAVLTPKLIHSGFLGNIALCEGLIGEIISLSKGVSYPSITSQDLTNISIPFPSKNEQNAIANYLDHKTTQIDTLIAKKEQFICLLQEERTAVINQAVTKGLDPKVKMKDSGIEWLGEIPEHWTSYRIDWVTDIVRGNTGFKKDELLKIGEYVALQYGKTYKVDIVDDSFNFFVNSEFFKESQVVSKGDSILISTSETVEDLGHTCFYNNGNIGLLGGEQILLKPNRKVLYEKYLYQYARQFGFELKKYAKGLKVFRFNTTDLKQIFIAIPSIEEQIKIADFLDLETIRIDSLISKSKQEIELLKEYKTALISEVVTGKVDVRDVILN